ncbi:MAG: hypothetical protein WCD81_08570 [Candidatus Bathyarchaeia archaeon]
MTRMKKPFKCPDCDSVCIEVGKPFYPKDIREPNVAPVYHEYRYACLKCQKEWIHDTYLRLILDVPDDSQYVYDFKTKEFRLRAEEKTET